MAVRDRYSISQKGSSVRLVIPVEEQDRFGLIRAMAECDRARGVCGSRECSKAANIEVDYLDKRLVLKWAPKTGVVLNLSAIEKCAAWLADERDGLRDARASRWYRWRSRISRLLGRRR